MEAYVPLGRNLGRAALWKNSLRDIFAVFLKDSLLSFRESGIEMAVFTDRLLVMPAE